MIEEYQEPFHGTLVLQSRQGLNDVDAVRWLGIFQARDKPRTVLGTAGLT